MRTIATTILAIALAAAPAAAHGPEGKASAMFEAYQKGNLPDRFKNRKNPLERAPANVEAGMKLYQANCVMCHGANADGKAT